MKKVEDKALPFFTRLYNRHREMVADLMREPDIESQSDLVQKGIEMLHAKRFKNKK